MMIGFVRGIALVMLSATTALSAEIRPANLACTISATALVSNFQLSQPQAMIGSEPSSLVKIEAKLAPGEENSSVELIAIVNGQAQRYRATLSCLAGMAGDNVECAGEQPNLVDYGVTRTAFSYAPSTMQYMMLTIQHLAGTKNGAVQAYSGTCLQ